MMYNGDANYYAGSPSFFGDGWPNCAMSTREPIVYDGVDTEYANQVLREVRAMRERREARKEAS